MQETNTNDLTELDGVGDKTAAKLNARGVETVADVLDATFRTLEVDGVGYETARKIRNSAREVLAEQDPAAVTLAEELEISKIAAKKLADAGISTVADVAALDGPDAVADALNHSFTAVAERVYETALEAAKDAALTTDAPAPETFEDGEEVDHVAYGRGNVSHDPTDADEGDEYVRVFFHKPAGGTPGFIRIHHTEDLTRVADAEDDSADETDEKLAELREFKERNAEAYDELAEACEDAKNADEDSEDDALYPDNPDTHNGHAISKDKYVTENRGGIGYTCECGYSGALYHPRRDRPTYHATRRTLCPTPDCNREMDTADKSDVLADSAETDGGEDQPEIMTDGGVDVDAEDDTPDDGGCVAEHEWCSGPGAYRDLMDFLNAPYNDERHLCVSCAFERGDDGEYIVPRHGDPDDQ